MKRPFCEEDCSWRGPSLPGPPLKPRTQPAGLRSRHTARYCPVAASRRRPTAKCKSRSSLAFRARLSGWRLRRRSLHLPVPASRSEHPQVPALSSWFGPSSCTWLGSALPCTLASTLPAFIMESTHLATSSTDHEHQTSRTGHGMYRPSSGPETDTHQHEHLLQGRLCPLSHKCCWFGTEGKLLDESHKELQQQVRLYLQGTK
jgi:hypothetical protein